MYDNLHLLPKHGAWEVHQLFIRDGKVTDTCRFGRGSYRKMLVLKDGLKEEARIFSEMMDSIDWDGMTNKETVEVIGLGLLLAAVSSGV